MKMIYFTVSSLFFVGCNQPTGADADMATSFVADLRSALVKTGRSDWALSVYARPKHNTVEIVLIDEKIDPSKILEIANSLKEKHPNVNFSISVEKN